MLKNFIFVSAALVCWNLNAQESKKNEAPKPAAELNWYLKDPKSDKVFGVGAEKAYQLLTGKTPKDVIVAVIDSGVETDHLNWLACVALNQTILKEKMLVL